MRKKNEPGSKGTRSDNKNDFLQTLQKQAIAWAAVEASKDTYGRPDPYVAGGLAAGMGMTSLEDSIRLGALLGTEGAFSSSPSSLGRYSVSSSKSCLDPAESNSCDFEDDSWRDWCEDGSEYGLDPEDFEDESEYEEALETAKSGWREQYEDDFELDIYPENYDTEEEYLEELNEAKAQILWREKYSYDEALGIDPEDYDTEEEYLDAVADERYAWREEYENNYEFDLYPHDFETEEEFLAAKAKIPKRSRYKSKRQYDAAVSLWNIEHGNREFSGERERRDRIARCQFILNREDVLAANYLTEDGKFNLVEAVRDHWTLPEELNRKADKEYIGNQLYKLLDELSDIDIALALDVWCWCVEQFHPYRQYEKEPGDAAEAIHMKMYLHTGDAFSLALLERIVKDPGLVSVIFSTRLHPDSRVEALVPLAMEKGYTKIARQIVEEYLNNENVPSKSMCQCITRVLADCSDPYELENYEVFVAEVFPVIKACKIPKIQRSIGDWEEQIARHIEYVEKHSEKYAYSRRFAWRATCPDGKEFGLDPINFDTEENYLKRYHEKKERYEREQRIAWRKDYQYDRVTKLSPHDFETEEEFLAAKEERKYLWRNNYARMALETNIDPEGYETEAEYLAAVKYARQKPMTADLDSIKDHAVYIYCGVVYQNGNRVYHYRTEDETFEIGDKVIVPVGYRNDEETAVIVSVERHTRLTVPFPVEKTKLILRRYGKETE